MLVISNIRYYENTDTAATAVAADEQMSSSKNILSMLLRTVPTICSGPKPKAKTPKWKTHQITPPTL